MPNDSDDSMFDKYIDDILIKERARTRGDAPAATDTPQRIYNKKYREYPNNRTKYTVNK